MTRPRLRTLAGPNGSGKTSLLRSLRDARAVPLGFNLNPDDVELTLSTSGRLAFAAWGVTTDLAQVRAHCLAHPLADRLDLNDVRVEDNTLLLPSTGPSAYLAAVLSDFLRRRWIADRASFTYETVMSSGDKVDLLEQARRDGYRTYADFVCTDDPSINVGRIAYRVTQGGHDVPAARIRARYVRSLALLPGTVAANDRAYLSDNSERAHRLVAECDAGRLVAAASALPNWFLTTMLNARPVA